MQGPRATHAAHHLVEDQQHTVAIADFTDALEVASRGGYRAERGADDRFRDESDHRLGAELYKARLELVGGTLCIGLCGFALVPVAVFVAGVDVVARNEDGGKGLAPPRVAADRERAQRVAVIALAAGDEMAALWLLALDEVLTRHLERGFDRLRSSRNQIDLGHARRRVGDELVRERLGHAGGEEARVGVREAIELCVHRGEDRGMLVTETGHRSASARIDVAPSFAVDEIDALAADGKRIPMLNLALKDVRHCAALRRCGGVT